MTKNKERIIEELKKSDGPVSVTSFRQAHVPEMNERTVRRIIKHLAAEGKVVTEKRIQEGRGTGGRGGTTIIKQVKL